LGDGSIDGRSDLENIGYLSLLPVLGLTLRLVLNPDGLGIAGLLLEIDVRPTVLRIVERL
jgi:hypothetical protein